MDDVEQRSVSELLSFVTSRVPADLVERAGGLERLSRADAIEIAEHLSSRRSRAARDAARAVAAAFELGRRVELARNDRPRRMTSADDIAEWARPRLATLEHEELWLVGVDGRGHVRGTRCIAKGGLHGAAVRPVDPLRAAVRMGAAAFVLVHNHPAGDPTPSPEDERFTAQLAAAAKVIGLPLLDHVVVAREGFSCVTEGSSA